MTEYEVRLARMNRLVFIVLAACMAMMTLFAAAVAGAQLLTSAPDLFFAALVSSIAAIFAFASTWASRIRWAAGG